MRSVLVAATAATLLAATPQAQEQAVFRASATYVEVTATVIDKQGRFVDGLTREDFDVREDYKRQTIAAFGQVDLPTRWRTPSTPGLAAAHNPERRRTQSASADRMYLLYLAGTPADMVVPTRELAVTFVQQYMQEGDVAAVWGAGRGLLEFTDDRYRLTTALRTFLGSGPGETQTVEQLGAFRDLGALPATLDRAVDWLGGVQGRKKSIIVFSPGWGGLAPAMARNASVGRASVIVDRADVQVYAVDTRGLVTQQAHSAAAPNTTGAAGILQELDDINRSLDNMRWLAEDAGGFAIINTNDPGPSLRRIVEDNSRYYVLGYESPMKKRPGVDFRRIEVKLKSTRPELRGATVRARKGYIVR